MTYNITILLESYKFFYVVCTSIILILILYVFIEKTLFDQIYILFIRYIYQSLSN